MRDWKALLVAGVSLSAAILCGGSPQARADAWKDEKLGYSFNYPGRWTVVPVDAGDWLVAKFNSNREYEVTNARNWSRQRPYIEVVVIPFAAKDDKGATVTKTDKETKVVRNAPWKDLKEYMDKTFQSRGVGGFHFSGEEAAVVGGLKVRKLEITVDKLVDGERRIYGWEFATDDAYYGLVAEILVQEEKRLKDDVFQSFSSFRAFPRTGSLPNSARTGEEVVVKDGTKKDEEKEVSPEELKKKRDDATARSLSRIKENLPKGWTIAEGKNFIAVSHADAKYTREVINHAEALRAWLEAQFGYVGSGYAGKVIIRVFGDQQEYSAYQQARNWSWDAPETVVFKDKEGWIDWGTDNMNREIFRIWMRDKNERLLWALPMWISWGLPDFVSRARSKSGRIEFKADVWDSVEMKTLRRSDKIFPAGSYFTMTSEAFWSQEGASTQTQYFINFLILGAGSRSAKYKNVLSDYIKGLIFLLDSEKPAGPADAVAAQPKNEKEEEEMIRAQREAWKKQEAAVSQKLLDRTFTSWTDKDWAAFDALYRQDLK
jgi:hypothetical protein